MVELVLFKIKATHQCPDGTIAWVQRHKSAFNFRQLGNLPGALGCFNHADHCAPPDFDVGGGLV